MNVPQEIIDAIVYITSTNKNLLVSGSVAIRLQSNIYPNREIGDIDFELPFEQ